MSTRADYRKMINSAFVLDPDLDAFLIDYFPDLSKALSRGMSRTEKLNLLLSSIEEEEIRRCLAQACPDNGGLSGQDVTSPANCSDAAMPLRKEIIRLQQIVKDREHQLSGQKFEPSIHSENGLERIRKCTKELAALCDSQASVSETQWMTWGHNSLDSLESELGRFHNISCDFRFHFYVAQEPVSEKYLALLRAAETILQQRAEESDRAVKSWAQTSAALNRQRNRGPLGGW